MDKISVIVPVYKVYNYLEKCFNSIANQTYKNLEIILVDDGSPDDCGKLCDELALRDKRVKVIHKPNGGLSDARNRGIEEATGEFLSFVDSDDYIKEDMLEFLYNNIIKSNADISTCGTYYIVNDTIKVDSGRLEGLFDSKEAIKRSLYGPGSSLGVWNKLYKKDLFSNIKFMVGKAYEDAYIMPSLFMAAEKIYMSSEPKYYYLTTRPDSITTKTFNEKSLDMIKAFEYNRDLMSEKYPELYDIFTYRIYLALINTFKKIIATDDYKSNVYFKELLNRIRGGTSYILKSKYFPLKNKMLILMLYLSPPLYVKLMRKHLNS